MWTILFGFVCTHAAEYLYINFQNVDEPEMKYPAITVENVENTVAFVEIDGQSIMNLSAFQSRRIDTSLLKNREAVLINVTSGRVTVHGVYQYETKEVQYEISDISQSGRDKYYLTSMMKHPSSCVVSATNKILLYVSGPQSKLQNVEILNAEKRDRYYELRPFDILFISSRTSSGLEKIYVRPINGTNIAVYCGSSYQRTQILPSSTHCGRSFNFNCPITKTADILSCKIIIFNPKSLITMVNYGAGNDTYMSVNLGGVLGTNFRVSSSNLFVTSENSDVCCLYREVSVQGSMYYIMLLTGKIPASSIPATQNAIIQTMSTLETKSSVEITPIAQTTLIAQTTFIDQLTSTVQATSMENINTSGQNTISTRRDSICRCACKFNITLVNPSSKELMERVKQLRKILSVDKLNLSSTKRQKKSASDSRSSAKGLGFVAISVLSIAVMIIMACDLHTRHVNICTRR